MDGFVNFLKLLGAIGAFVTLDASIGVVIFWRFRE